MNDLGLLLASSIYAGVLIGLVLGLASALSRRLGFLRGAVVALVLSLVSGVGWALVWKFPLPILVALMAIVPAYLVMYVLVWAVLQIAAGAGDSATNASFTRTALVLLPIGAAFAVLGVSLLHYVMNGDGFIGRAMAVAVFWPALLVAWLCTNVQPPDYVVFLVAFVLEYLYLWGLASFAARQFRAHAGQPLRPAVRVLLTVLAYLGLVAIVGVTAVILVAVVVGDGHDGLLPEATRPVLLTLACLTALILPVLGARALWRRLGPTSVRSSSPQTPSSAAR
jgi:hypothetical protein